MRQRNQEPIIVLIFPKAQIYPRKGIFTGKKQLSTLFFLLIFLRRFCYHLNSPMEMIAEGQKNRSWSMNRRCFSLGKQQRIENMIA